MSKISNALRELLLARAAGTIDSEEFERRQAALHAELLADDVASTRRTWWLLGAGLAVAAIAIAVYVWKASEPAPAIPASLPPMMSPAPSAMAPPMTALPPMSGAPGQTANAGGDLKIMAVRLAEKLAKNPTNGEGWALLGQTYMELHQYKEADQAFAKADALGKVDARLKEEWAKAKAAGKK